MRFIAVLNRDGGTLRTTDLDAFSAADDARRWRRPAIASTSNVVAGKDIEAALDKARRRAAPMSSWPAAATARFRPRPLRLMGKKKALAILPAGTMNLFARGLGIPQSLDAAVEAFADGEIKAVDMASANGRPFVHQFSIGMHAKMVHAATRWNSLRGWERSAPRPGLPGDRAEPAVAEGRR